MSLKEKLQVILNQKGQFRCPNGASKTTTDPKPKPVLDRDRYTQVVANLKQRGHSKPGTVTKLKSTIASLFKSPLSTQELELLVQQLQSDRVISIAGSKVTYAKSF
jgi:hypothetical protein